MSDYLQLTALFVILLVFSIFAFRRKSLDIEGVILSNAVGVTIFLLGGFYAFLTLVLFFVAAETCTRIARRRPSERHETRTAGNILGNSAAAVVALWFDPWLGFGMQLAYYCAISAAMADTLSSEIGLLSKRKPRLITTLEEVEPGTDGAVSVLGTVAAILSAALIGLIHAILFGNVLSVSAIIVAGTLGSMADSLAGAVFERKGVINNTHVNMIGSFSGMLIGVALYILLVAFT
jgi:uncharacterized protein (TIGR00297 family)